jgi:hypothetical protein
MFVEYHSVPLMSGKLVVLNKKHRVMTMTKTVSFQKKDTLKVKGVVEAFSRSVGSLGLV